MTPAIAASMPVARALIESLLTSLGNPPFEVVLWNGERIAPPAAMVAPIAQIHVRDRATLWQLLRAPDLAFGEAFMHDQVDVHGDLVETMSALYHSRARADTATTRGTRWKALRDWLAKRISTPSQRATAVTSANRRNIHQHYDLGNDFFAAWLDEEMVYTCAYFPSPGLSLKEAQRAKMDHVCRKLRLKPGDHVVDAGCGWGALARHMAREWGCRVTAYNISSAQLAWATQQVRADGLASQITLVEDDYRNIRGDFDAVVSVGMLEHVGIRHYDVLGGVLERCLKPSGLGLVHSIGQDRPEPLNPWIAQRIFPGAEPPTLSAMTPLFERSGLTVLDVENLRLHYAETLAHWLARFDEARDMVEAQYGRAFSRAWRLYLAGSLAAFRTGELQLFQVLFAHRASNTVPRTRQYQYPGGAAQEATWMSVTH